MRRSKTGAKQINKRAKKKMQTAYDLKKPNYLKDRQDHQSGMMVSYILLWLLGVPVRILLVIFLSRCCR